MNNTLTFYSVYKSITSLPEIEVPNFVVLTGKNGSGKTHLLEAITKGHVKSNLVADVTTDVLMYDWNSIIPEDTGVFQPHQYLTKRSNWFDQIRNSQDAVFPALQQQVLALGIPLENCSTIYKIKNLDARKLGRLFSDEEKAKHTLVQIEEAIRKHGQQVYQQSQRHIGDENWIKVAPEVVSEMPELFLETSESMFFNNKKFLWGEVNPFQQAFGKLFSTYRELIHQNDRLKQYPPQGDSDLEALNDEQFINTYGEPPWDFVNKILGACDLDFRVDDPPLRETSSYEPRLTKLSSEVEMRFQDLSSGERVLMSFALCLYNASDFRQEKRFPKLLLLDEVDAPLHPSMVLSLLNTIQDVLVDDKNVSVILTTHSPSTVALAPEEAIYEMSPIGPSIEKCGKSRALSILTAGVPTLSISFEGRRQVFVESKCDAKLYEKLYLSYKDRIKSERSLTFIEVGHTDQSGAETNSGCSQVNRIVNALVENGNESVLGLVDWDGRVTSSPRIKVLSANLRDGIESLMFDPVLIATIAIKENINFSRQKGLISEIDSYTSISNWDSSKWQGVADTVQTMVVGSGQLTVEKIDITYLNGMTLSLRKDYLYMDDHELEGNIIRTFGFLKPKSNRAGGLMNHVHDSILSDYPTLLPRDLLDTFEELLEENI